MMGYMDLIDESGGSMAGSAGNPFSFIFCGDATLRAHPFVVLELEAVLGGNGFGSLGTSGVPPELFDPDKLGLQPHEPSNNLL